VAEVVGREPRAALPGDMPHTWCGSDFIRSALDLLADEDGDGLVLAAGVPAGWTDPGERVAVSGLVTHFGPLSYRMVSESGRLVVTIDAIRDPPPGGVLVKTPGLGEASHVTIDGREAGGGRRRGRDRAAGGGGDRRSRGSMDQRLLGVGSPAPRGGGGGVRDLARERGCRADHRFRVLSLELGGWSHSYALYVPRAYDASRAWPLILFLHGSGASAAADGSRQLRVGPGPELLARPERAVPWCSSPEARQGR
jgi:hypothetical protein